MNRIVVALALAVGVVAQAGLFGGVARAAGPVVQVVEINGHRARFDGPGQAVVRYMLIDPANADPQVDGFAPVATKAVLMLFIGGDGRIGMAPGQQNIGSPNFLARTRYHFAAEGYVVAVVDAASDFLAHNHPNANNQGSPHATGLKGHRLPERLHGDKYLQDLTAVSNDLRARYPGLPLWAVGTSRGTVAAAVLGAVVNPPPDGLVLTATVTGPDPFENVHDVDLSAIRAPVLIVSHLRDECPTTPADGSKALRQRLVSSSRVQALTFNGGSTNPLTDPCDPLSPHGFFGVEQPVIEAITRWIEHARK